MGIKNVGLLASVSPDKGRINTVIYTAPEEAFTKLEIIVVNQDPGINWFCLGFGTNDKLDRDKMIEYKRAIAIRKSFRIPGLIVGPKQQLVSFLKIEK